MEFEERFTLFEVFSGKGRVSEFWSLAGITVHALLAIIM